LREANENNKNLNILLAKYQVKEILENAIKVNNFKIIKEIFNNENLKYITTLTSKLVENENGWGMKPPVRGQREPGGKARPAPWLETLRLEMRDFHRRDLDDLWRLGRDPRVMRFIGDGKPLSRDGVARMLARMVRYPALYPILVAGTTSRRDTGAFVGWFSLKYAGKSPDIEIGYWLVPGAWGRGFATEGARAARRLRLRGPRPSAIIGVTHPANQASQRVLTKAGLEDAGWGCYYGRRLRLFAATNPGR